MARKPGSLVLDRLRERILVGRYFGRWAPGDRLPSVRDVAGLESVDRKTAAAAYRRLEGEGLVRIEARSGVYLVGDGGDGEGDPLRRLHARWLDHTISAAVELGLGPARVAHMLECVVRVREREVLLVDDDADHGVVLAAELARPTGLTFDFCRPGELGRRLTPDARPPFVVATPLSTDRVRAVSGCPPVVAATLAPDLLRHLASAAEAGPVLVLVPSQGLARELGRALAHGLVPAAGRIRVVMADGAGKVSPETERRVILWPGCVAPPPGTSREADLEVDDLRCRDLLSAATTAAVRRQVIRCALSEVSTSNAA